MSKYVPILQQILNQLYPKEKSQEIANITINNIHFEKIYQPTSQHLEQFYNVTQLCINYCDLRTLKNFPTLPQLCDLDISHNGLQGTFQYLLRNKTLQYINASNNLISDPMNILPLKKFKKMSICLKDNPICLKQNWNTKIKISSIKILKQPKKNSKAIIKNQHVQQKKNNQNRTEKSPNLFGMHGYRFSEGKFIVSYANDDPSQNLNDSIRLQLKKSINGREMKIIPGNRSELEGQLSLLQDQLDGQELLFPEMLQSFDHQQQQDDENDEEELDQLDDSSSSQVAVDEREQ